VRLSFSQLGTYESCKLKYFYSYVKKIDEKDVETKYLDFGSCVHDTIEQYYKEQLPWMYYFDRNWAKYRLEGRMDKNLGKKCVENALSRNYKPTDVEKRMYITTPISFVGIFDVIDEKNSIIADWKTSTYSDEAKEDYKKQLLCYAWLYYMKTGEIIKKCVLEFIKVDKVFEWSFTEQDIMKFDGYVTKMYDEIAEFRETTQKETEIDRDINGCYWCGYKWQCPQWKDEMTYTLTIRGSRFYVDEGEITPLLEKGINKVFSYTKQGSTFIERATSGRWDGTINFWSRRTKSLPIGFLDRFKTLITAYAKQKGFPIHIDVVNTHNNDVNLSQGNMPKKLKTELREYQKDAALAAINKQIGFIQSPTGSGKTLIAAEIIRILDKKTLFIVDRKELLTQAKEEFERELGCDVGIVAEGKIDTEKQVVVATIQSLNAKRSSLTKFLENVGCVMADESHKAAAKSYTQLFSAIKNADHRIGITATVKRDDGEEMQFQSILGDVIYDIDVNTLIKEGFLMKPDVYFVDYDNETENTRDYNEYYNMSIVNNVKRNEMAKDIVLSLVLQGMKVLILTKRIEHAKDMYNWLKTQTDNIAMILGETKKDERESMFNLFRDGKLKVLIGTQSIFSEGVNVKSLNAIVNLAGNKGEVKTVQMIGRVMRTLAGKEKAMYIDFNDHHLFGKSHSRKRREILEEMGYEVQTWA